MLLQTLPEQEAALGEVPLPQFVLGKTFRYRAVDLAGRESLQDWEADLCAEGEVPLLREPVVGAEQGVSVKLR